MRTPKFLCNLLLFILSLTFLTTCATNPVTGKRQISFISEEQEINMGTQYDPSIVAEMGVYQDADLAAFLTEKGNEMAAISERPNLPWTFRLVDSEVVNAFAVPGGYIYFTRGIMAHFNNEAEFAGVLGHEIGHVTARHTVAQQSKQTLAQIGLIGGMILSPELASQGESLMQGMQLLFLKFGRDAESQSDQLGVKYSTQIGYDAKEMAGFFSTLSRLSGGPENRVPSFLSTHPDPADREQRVAALAQEYQAADQSRTTYEVDRESWLQRIDGILYGADPKQGFVENSAFYHPELRFQFAIPNNWRLVNSPTQVQVVSPDQNAILQMRLAQGTSPEQAAREFAQQNGVQVANSSGTSINGLPAYTIIGDVVQQAQQGQQGQSIRVLASFISYGGNIYMLVGMSLPQNFNRYQRSFESLIGSFRELTDQSKINRQPERIKIMRTDRSQTLQQALLSSGIPQNRLEEMSIVNGIPLNTTLPANYMFKSLVGGNRNRI